MGTFKEYDRYDGLGMAELVRKKDISPADLYEEAISRIEKLNPQLNAVIAPIFDLAQKDIEKGLPMVRSQGFPF